jgi:hypothetical protein
LDDNDAPNEAKPALPLELLAVSLANGLQFERTYLREGGDRVRNSTLWQLVRRRMIWNRRHDFGLEGSWTWRVFVPLQVLV